MLTSTRRDGRYRIFPPPLGRRDADDEPTRPRLHHTDHVARVAGWRVWGWLTSTVALTLLGVTGAAVIVISPLAVWRAPVEVCGLALIGVSVAALIRQAFRP